MKDRIKNYKHIVPLSYIVFFVLAFFVFLVMTFPGDVVKQRIVSEIKNSSPYMVDINDASVSALLNVNLTGVKIYKSQDQFLELDKLTIKPSLFSVFSSSPKIPFTANLYGGKVDGTIRIDKQKNKIQEVSASIKDVRVNSIPDLISNSGKAEILLNGIMDGELYVQMDPIPDGDFSFEIQGLEVDNFKVKGMKLPTLTNLVSKFNGDIAENVTNIKELSVKGEGIDLQITGTAPLLWEMSKGGILDLGYRVEITDTKLAKYKTFLSPYLAKHRDGSLGGKILGTVMNPRFEKGSIKRF